MFPPPGFILIPQRLSEAADMAHSNVRAMLSDAVHDAHRGTGKWASYLDHTGDGETGDCIYTCDGDTKSAPYQIGEVGGKKAATLLTADAKKVVPVTSYEETADDDAHYTAMEAALKASNTYAALPLYERFIPKGERDKADADSFAGKNKSFPILKKEDVGAAVHAMGRAGSANFDSGTLKANIIRIAKAKGWGSELPKAWQSGMAKEAVKPAASESGLKLVESAATVEAIVLREAKADYEIKLIAPGKGSSAFYPAEVLKRDGPQVFKAGTHVYLNHPTLAEEAARPEGDVKNLAGVLTTDAVYHESHPKGEGLYGRMKVFADHATTVAEKAPHVGMSIRAAGVAESGKTREGVPILKQLTHAESVDVVTRAGAGGMILTEAARDAAQPNTQEDEMSEQEKAELREAARVVREGRARTIATLALADVSLIDAGKARVIETVIRNLPLKDGVLDEAKLTETVKAEAKREGEYLATLMPMGVRGMGAAPVVQMSEADRAKAKEAEKLALEESASIFGDLMGDPTAAKFAAKGRAA